MADYIESLRSLGQQLCAASSITLLSHARPDGDAYGSVLGLGITLRALGKSVTIYNEDGLIEMYQFLPECKLVTPTPTYSPQSGLILSLDTSTKERLGKSFLTWNQEVDYNLDHHVSNTLYAKNNIINPAMPATAALVIDLIQLHQWPLPASAASCLYVGLSTDTGSFRYRGTNAHTFRQAAYLLDSGANAAELAIHCYQSMTPERFALLRLAYGSLETDCCDSLAYYTLTPEMFDSSQAKSEDTEGIVETALLVKSVEVGALFEHKRDGSLKVSLRSKGKVNVSVLATSFGGGGHPGAAGITFKSDGLQQKEKVLNKIKESLYLL